MLKKLEKNNKMVYRINIEYIAIKTPALKTARGAQKATRLYIMT